MKQTRSWQAAVAILFAILSVLILTVSGFATGTENTPPAGEQTQTQTQENTETVVPPSNKKITVEIPGGGGTVSINGTAAGADGFAVKPGESVKISAIPQENYAFVQWETTGIALSAPKAATAEFVMPDSDVTLRATFQRVYSVTVDGEKWKSFPEGASVNLTASDVAGKKFIKWNVQNGSVSLQNPAKKDVSFTMPKNDVQLTREYENIVYSFQVEVAGKGKVQVKNKSLNANGYYECIAGEEISLVATPDEGYSLVLWSGTSSVDFSDYTQENTVLICPASDFTVKVQFAAGISSLTLAHTEGGTVTPEANFLPYPVDTVVELEAKPNPGYVFDHWECTGTMGRFADANSAKTTFVMPNEHCTVTAVFRPSEEQTFTIKAVGGGKVEGDSGNYQIGNVITLTAVPDEGYRFSHWEATVEGILSDRNSATTQVTVPGEDVELTAFFEKNEWGADQLPWIPLTAVALTCALAILVIVLYEKYRRT